MIVYDMCIYLLRTRARLSSHRSEFGGPETGKRKRVTGKADGKLTES